MYGNVYYNKFSSKIHWSEYDNEGKRECYSMKWAPSFYIEKDEETDIRSLDGSSLTKIQPKKWKERKEALSGYKDSGRRIFGSDIPPEDLFILEKWPNAIENIPDLRYAFIDIEVESENGFPHAEKALERINLITIYASHKKKFVVFGLEHAYTPKSENVKYIQCKTEVELLKKFVNYVSKLGIDAISGWNSAGYDMPYIFNRVLRILDNIDLELFDAHLNFQDRIALPPDKRQDWENEKKKMSWIKKLSPYGKVEKRRVRVKDQMTKQMKDAMSYKIEGLTDFDYLLLYKQFEFNKKESYKLDFIGELEVNERKVEFEGTFKELYTNNWETWVDYNIQDVNLLVKLDHKLEYIKQSVLLSYVCHCVFSDNTGTVTKIDCLIYNYLFQKGLILEDDSTKEARLEDDSGKFTGAFVKEPVPAMYEWLIDVDLASLYPNTIININISPETKMFRVDYQGVLWDCDDDLDLDVIYPDKEIVNRKAGEIKKEIKDNGYTLSSYNVAFISFNKQKGIIPEILDHLYKGRKSKKKESFSYTQKQKDLFDNCPEYHSHGDDYVEVDGIVDDEKIVKAMTKEQHVKYSEFKRQEEIAYALQLSLKIVLNSIYGYTGTKYSRFYDVDLAMSTTLSGQTITCDSSDMIEDYFKHEFLKSKLVKKKFPNATPKDIEGPVCGYNDTDSAFLTFREVMDNMGIPEEKYFKTTQQLANLSVQKMNAYGNHISTNIFNSDNNRIEWDNELLMPRALFLKKKKYCAHVKVKDGFDVDEILIKGLDAIRSSTPAPFQKSIKKTIELVMKGMTADEFKEHSLGVYDDFMSWDLRQIYLPKSCNKLAHYDQAGGLQGIKGTPGHVNSAIAFNYFLRDYGLVDDEPIKEGEKFRMVYLRKHHDFPIKALGFLTKIPAEFGLSVENIDRRKHFELCYIQPLQPIINVVGWRMPNFFEEAMDMSSLFV
jgi:DNA polymerase elongation subunit (family B)